MSEDPDVMDHLQRQHFGWVRCSEKGHMRTTLDGTYVDGNPHGEAMLVSLERRGA